MRTFTKMLRNPSAYRIPFVTSNTNNFWVWGYSRAIRYIGINWIRDTSTCQRRIAQFLSSLIAASSEKCCGASENEKFLHFIS